jgi:hypothetical protein
VGLTKKRKQLNFEFDFQTKSNLFCSKGGLPVLENFEIKYGAEGVELRNNFPYWNFSRFRREFELNSRKLLSVEF